MLFARRRRLPAYRVYLAMGFFSALFSRMVFTVSGIWAVQNAALSPLELVLVGTALEASCFLFEIPTGVVADSYSRRLSIIIGVALTGVGYLVWGAFALFPTIVLAQVLWGIGYTFISGAAEAWISDEMDGAPMTAVFLRSTQAQQTGALAGILAAVVVARFAINAPMLAGGVLMILLSMALALVMPEHGFTPASADERGSWGGLGRTAVAGLRTVRGSAALMTILAIGLIFGASTEAFDRLSEAHFLRDTGLPRAGGMDAVAWFAVMSDAALVLGLAVTEIVRRRVDAESHRRAAYTLLGLDSLLMLSVAGFALAGNFAVAFPTYLSARLLRTTRVPLFTAWLNRGLEPSVRATVLSMGGQADALGQVAGGPVLGALASAVSIPAAMLVTSLVMLPALALYVRTAGRPAIALADPLTAGATID
jgi:DHA3 family tetracycline resistance protein-like MFS transporter